MPFLSKADIRKPEGILTNSVTGIQASIHGSVCDNKVHHIRVGGNWKAFKIQRRGCIDCPWPHQLWFMILWLIMVWLMSMKQYFLLLSESLIPDTTWWGMAETELHMWKSEGFKFMALVCKMTLYILSRFSFVRTCVFRYLVSSPMGPTLQTNIHILAL